MRRRYCTHFDSQYLARGLAMVRSLRRWDAGAVVTVLALDTRCEAVVREVFAGAVEVLPVREFLVRDAGLRRVLVERTAWEFYATGKPVLVGLMLREAEEVVYIDADTWFFSSPEAVLAEMDGAQIGISPHRFSEGNLEKVRYGVYNAGFVVFRDGAEARRCVEDWRRACLEWCGEQPLADGRFMNQGYLNGWPERHAGVRVFEHPGANLAPWNVEGVALEMDGGRVMVDGRELVFFHFSGGRAEGFSGIYGPYLRAVAEEREFLLGAYGVTGEGSVRSQGKMGGISW